MPRVQLGDVELDYWAEGRGEPMVLIMGIGASGALWDDDFVARLAARGFELVRFDHRDIGQSTRLDHLPVPHPRTSLLRRMAGLAVDAPYTLSHLAGDVIGLMDHLGWARAHVVGVSMGGMIGQHLAIEHPARVLSLTSLSSTCGRRRYLPAPRALAAMFRPRPRSSEEAVDHVIELFGVIGSPAFPGDPERLRALATRAVARGLSPRGYLRHFAAIMASGDRTPRLRHLGVPSLVVHGDADPLIPVGAGRATARAIPGAWWLPIAGMGHDLPEQLWPRIVDAVTLRARTI